MDKKYAIKFKLAQKIGISGICIAFATQSICLPLLAYAEDTQDPGKPQIIANEIKQIGDRLQCKFTYLSNEDPKIAPDKYSYNGIEYEIDTREVPVDDTSYIPLSKTFNISRSSQVPLNGINNLYEYFPVELPIDEDEFVGNIGLDQNPFTYTKGYSTQTDTVTRTAEFSNLTDPENSLVPQEYAFTVKSNKSENATEVKNLTLTHVSFSPQSWTEYGEIATYKALCTYSGTEDYLVLTHYNVDARYKGKITSSIKRMVVNATYKPIIEEIVEEPEQFNWTPYIIAGAATVAAGSGIVIAFWIKRKQKVRFVNAQAGNKTLELIKPIINGTNAYVEIPPLYDLTNLNLYAVVLPNRVLKNCDCVKLSIAGYEFYVGKPKEVIPAYCEKKF